MINKAAVKTIRKTVRMPLRMLRRVERLQKQLNHASTSETLRHLAEKGLEAYTRPRKGKKKRTQN
ncbi:MAG: hypothetical protein PHH85_02180 [Candidatus Methanoperedens sp.]|nr:hypothetical protein [Candidatus Methanoperedens sp.]